MLSSRINSPLNVAGAVNSTIPSLKQVIILSWNITAQLSEFRALTNINFVVPNAGTSYTQFRYTPLTIAGL
jgi:hypothetical protein